MQNPHRTDVHTRARSLLEALQHAFEAVTGVASIDAVEPHPEIRTQNHHRTDVHSRVRSLLKTLPHAFEAVTGVASIRSTPKNVMQSQKKKAKA
jgi:hypothetical protein